MPPRAGTAPTHDELRRYRRLRVRFLLQLDQRTGREKMVLRRTIAALSRRLQ